MRKPLSEQVVVITGASSGIGRETALQLADAGARLVLAARNRDALESLAAEVTARGGTPEVVPTDVSDYEQVVRLADRAVERFGGFDTWVNNASVTLYGTVLDTDVAEIRRVVDVNLLGAVYGMKVAAGHLSRAGHGTIVNVSSVLGRRAVPLQAPYCAAKHGVLGFAEALRLELRRAGAGVKVVDVLPSSINTPLFDHARSRLPVAPQPIPPIYEPRVAAEAIIGAIERPVRTVFAGGAARLVDLAQRLSPRLVDWAMLRGGLSFRLQETSRPDDGDDNLDRPSTGTGATAGRFGEHAFAHSAYTRYVGLHPVRAGALAAAGVAGIALAGRRTRH